MNLLFNNKSWNQKTEKQIKKTEKEEKQIQKFNLS
jgi:hypothetical protein